MIIRFIKRFYLFFITLSFLFIIPVSFASNVIEVTFFTAPGCPHCNNAKTFLNQLKKDFEKNQENSININELDFSRNLKIARELYQEYGVSNNQQGLVPTIFVGEKYFVGFSEQTEQEIREYILNQELSLDNNDKKIINIPILGELDVLSVSLPILAITLGIIDGFNVCSLGALLVILGLVMVLRSRKRIVLMGGAFLLTSAIMYGVLILLRHQLFSFIAPYIKSMEILIGILALGGGIYLLREFYKAYKSGPICSSNNLMSRLVPKIQKIFKEKTNRLILLGAVMLFATIVTVIEFPCSAFLPVLFTSILADSGVSFNTSLLYIGLYMLMYLLDEIIIFAIAVITLKIKIVSPKFIIFFNLLAAFIFIGLGIYYILGLF